MIQLNKCPICENSEFKNFLTLKDYMITNEEFNIVSCQSCDLHFTNPKPSVEKIGNYYKSEKYVSHSSSKKGFINFIYNIVRSYTLRKKVQLLKNFSKGNELLEIGSGTGHFLNKCLLYGYSVQGLEPDDEAKKFAKENFQLNLEDLEELNKIEESSKDIITMWHVLEHVYDLNKDFTIISKLLKPDGIFFDAVPNYLSFDAQYYQSFWAAYDVPRHLYHFKQKDIENLAEKNNLSLVAIKPMKFDSYYVSMLSEKYNKGSMIRAIWIAFLSNLKGGKMGYSSQIYVLKKN